MVEALGEGDVPTVGDIEELYGGILESVSIRDEESVRFAKSSQPVFVPVTPGEVTCKHWENLMQISLES